MPDRSKHRNEITNGTLDGIHKVALSLPEPPTNAPDIPPSISRRSFMQSVAVAATGASIPFGYAENPTSSNVEGQIFTPSAVAPAQLVVLRINGKLHNLSLEPRVTLLDALREVVGLTGTKKGCDRGQCGACTVLVDGRRINACLTLAIMHEGREITTVEGLSGADNLHPLQSAFLDSDALQCGYCTPGQLCSAVALITEWHAGAVSAVTQDFRHLPVELTDQEIRERMSGNLCRCGAYPNIVTAISVAAKGG